MVKNNQYGQKQSKNVLKKKVKNVQYRQNSQKGHKRLKAVRNNQKRP